jgi:hypothetical protein
MHKIRPILEHTMSACQFPTADTTAFRLAALLEEYEQHVGELTSTWLDAALYARVSREIGEMRLLCAALPLLSVPWVHLLISHAELVHCLWTCPPDGEESHPAERCKAHHLVAIRALRQKCLFHFTRIERVP